MTLHTAPVTLADLQRPLRARLDHVPQELRRIVEADFGLIAQVNSHLFQMQGKMFRPTLLLLADEATGALDPRTTTLAAVVELIHLATLVHDDSVDHSVLRRGMPTINSLFSHQISVIMGDYLYSRAVIELVRARRSGAAPGAGPRDQRDDRRRDAAAPGPRAAGVYRGGVRSPDPAKTASLLSGACEVRCPPGATGRAGGALGGSVERWAWLFRSWTTCSTTRVIPASPASRAAGTCGSTRSRCHSCRPSPDERSRPAGGESTDGHGGGVGRPDRRGDRGGAATPADSTTPGSRAQRLAGPGGGELGRAAPQPGRRTRSAPASPTSLDRRQ